MDRIGWMLRLAAMFAALCVAAGVRGDIGTGTYNWSSYGNWGYCYTATYGQTFVGNGEACSGVRFRFYSESCCSSVPFRAVLCRWDSANSRAVGPILAQADSIYSTIGCCWFDYDVSFPTKVPLANGQQYVVFFTVTPWWNQYGCRNANFATVPDYYYTSGGMYVLGNGGDQSQWFNSSWSYTGYDINFTVRTTTDCDGNGINDSVEIADGTAPDCNANGLNDRCEQLPPDTQTLSGDERGPIGSTASAQFDFDRVIPAQGDVQLRIDAIGDLSATHEFLLLSVGTGAAHAVFTTAASDCVWLNQTITIPRDEFNAAIDRKSHLRVTVSGSPTVDAAACAGESKVKIMMDYREDYRDCNENLIADYLDFCSGVSLDCNGNYNPDECDIANGSSADVDGDGVPDECQPDCNGDHRPDAFQILVGEEPDCNHNGHPDECDLYTGGGSVDCNSNGVPDECDIASGTSPDCDGDGKIDSCALAQGLVRDCNGNGVPDSCDIASGFSQDCNGNAMPDSCEVVAAGYVDFYSPQSSMSVAQPFFYRYEGARPSSGDVYMEVNCYTYTSCYNGQFGRVRLDGIEVYSWYDCYWGCCNSGNHGFWVSRDTWNQIAADGVISCEVRTQNNCGGDWARLRFIYTRTALAKDCNHNGIPDECDISSGFDHDCNNNGQLDSCDIAQGAEDDNQNGYPDPCELDRGDLNLDGIVDGADLGILLSYWGGFGFTIGDCDHDGLVGASDLGVLLGHWGIRFE